jgi:predicted DNA-binding transcriptional regulator AlpA
VRVAKTPSETLSAGERYKNLNTAQVMEYIGATRRETVWAYVKGGKLPKPRYLSAKHPVWRLGEVIDHLEGVLEPYDAEPRGIIGEGEEEAKPLKADRSSVASKLREKLNLGGLGKKKG